MFRVDTSPLPFEETITRLKEAALQNGWVIPDSRDLQQEYHQAEVSDMTRCTVLYFCNPQGGYSILKNDSFKAMSVMMPMGVSVYETNEGQVEIAAMNLGLMGNFFSGVVKDVLVDGGERYQKSIEAVVETR